MKKKSTIAIMALIALAAFLCMIVATNANRMQRVKTWLGLDAPPTAESCVVRLVLSKAKYHEGRRNVQTLEKRPKFHCLENGCKIGVG